MKTMTTSNLVKATLIGTTAIHLFTTASYAFSPSTGTDVFHRYYILRHGETDANASGRIQGSSDISRLTERGRAQAAAAGQAIFGGNSGIFFRNDFLGDVNDAMNGNNVAGGLAAAAAASPLIDRVYVSPLTRARETLSVLRQHASPSLLPPSETILHDLREIDLYSWEGKYKSELQQEDPHVYDAWKVGDAKQFHVEGKRPIVEVWNRANTVWDRVYRRSYSSSSSSFCSSSNTTETSFSTKEDVSSSSSSPSSSPSSTLLVCHGTLGQALLNTAFGFDETNFRKHEFPNCGLIEILWKVDEDVATRWRWHHPQPSDRWIHSHEMI